MFMSGVNRHLVAPFIMMEPEGEPMTEGVACQHTLLRGVPNRSALLQKLGGTSFGIASMKSWKDRWVVVDGPLLKYYAGERDAMSPTAEPRGILSLDGATLAHIQHPKSQSSYVFQVTTAAGRKEPFICGSEEEFHVWMDTIQGVIDALSQFKMPTHAPPMRAPAPAAAPVQHNPAPQQPLAPAPAAPASNGGGPPPAMAGPGAGPGPGVAPPPQHDNMEAIRRASLPPPMGVTSPVPEDPSAAPGAAPVFPHPQPHPHPGLHAPAPVSDPTVSAPPPAAYGAGPSPAVTSPGPAASPASLPPPPGYQPGGSVYSTPPGQQQPPYYGGPPPPGSVSGSQYGAPPPPGSVSGSQYGAPPPPPGSQYGGSQYGAPPPPAAAPPPGSQYGAPAPPAAAPIGESCSKCGTAVAEAGALFCENCGNRLR